ncbi:hypothetical protein JCM5353_000290 [Sporobolomyces roseus]
MQLLLLLVSLFTLLVPSALAQFNEFGDDDSFGVGGFNGIDRFGGGDNFFDSAHPIEGKKSKDGKYYVQTWSQVKSKGYPQPQTKKILRDQKKGEQVKDVDGDRKSVDEGEKKKGVGEKGGKKEGGIVDDAFGKGFDDFVGVD